MAKIQFRSGKTKVKVFLEEEKKDSKEPTIPVLFEQEQSISFSDSQKPQENKPKSEFRNAAEVLENLYSTLILRFNFDTISVYQLSSNKYTDGRLHCRKIYGADINEFEIEKYFGYSCPFILTNASGFTDNRLHRARFIERFGDRLVVVSSSAYEVFRHEHDLQIIRSEIRSALKEVDKL